MMKNAVKHLHWMKSQGLINFLDAHELQQSYRDRKGMNLADEDVIHYKAMITTIHRTIELMGEIDKLVEC